MGLPESIRVKISSEEAQSISLTPVVLREMPVRELIEALLGVAGKDAERIRRLLGRGAVVSGGSRLRWEGWTADLDAIRAVLATFPDPEPARPFAAAACVRAVLRGGNTRIEISREVGMERRLFRKERFWDALMEAAAAAAPRYAGYSYRERADLYTVEIGRETAARLRECAARLRYSSLEARVCRADLEALELFVERR
jgi:hypothetical protein